MVCRKWSNQTISILFHITTLPKYDKQSTAPVQNIDVTKVLERPAILCTNYRYTNLMIAYYVTSYLVLRLQSTQW